MGVPLSLLTWNMNFDPMIWATQIAACCETFAYLDDLLASRVLFLLPVIYRKWASVRRKSLHKWIQTLADDDIFTIAAAAEDAWWCTALQLEHCRSEGIEFTGGSADLAKAFDEVQRQLLYEVLKIGGMPQQVLNTYENTRSP